MPQSTIKKNLLDFANQTSIRKAEVDHQINSWLQTYKKEAKKKVSKPKFNVHKRNIFKPVYLEQQPFLEAKQQLKNRKRALMITPEKLKNLKVMNQSTQATSNNQRNSIDNGSSRLRKNSLIPVMHVNQFIVDERQHEKIRNIFSNQIPRKVVNNQKQTVGVRANARKQSLEHLKKLQKLDCLVKQRTLNYSVQIVQQNFCKNKYRGLSYLTKHRNNQSMFA